MCPRRGIAGQGWDFRLSSAKRISRFLGFNAKRAALLAGIDLSCLLGRMLACERNSTSILIVGLLSDRMLSLTGLRAVVGANVRMSPIVRPSRPFFMCLYL